MHKSFDNTWLLARKVACDPNSTWLANERHVWGFRMDPGTTWNSLAC